MGEWNLAHLQLEAVVWVLLIVVAVGLLIEVFGIFCMFRFRLRQTPEISSQGPAPGITIIKPCYSAEDEEKANFETFFGQDYPGPVELLFVVSSESDPIVPLIREVLARHRAFDARLLVSQTRRACWRKVDAIYDGHRAAKHDIVVWSDSDVQVEPGYLRQIAAALLEPGISLVTTPQYEQGADNFATALKTLANNCDIGVYLSIADLIVREKKFAWGHSLAYRRSELEEFGPEAWEFINRFYADDQSVPFLFATRGKKTVFRNISCPVTYSGKTWSQMSDQKKRWAVAQRLVYPNRVAWLVGMLGIPQVSSFFLMLATGFSRLGIAAFGLAALVRLISSVSFEILYLRSISMNLKYFWTIPISDLLQIYYRIVACFSNSVSFHGKRYRIVDRYFMEPLAEGESDAPASGISKWLKNWSRATLTGN